MSEKHSIVDELAHAYDQLTPERLKPFSSEAKASAVDAAVDSLSSDEAALAAIVLAAHEDAGFREIVENAARQDLTKLYDYLNDRAPRLLKHPRLVAFANRLKASAMEAELADESDSGGEKSQSGIQEDLLPFDDVEAAGFTIHYLASTAEPITLVPTLRFEVKLAGAAPIKLQLRMIDVAFLAEAFLDGLNDAVSNVRTIQEKGLLEPGEMSGISETIRDAMQIAAEIEKKVRQLTTK